MLYVMVDRREDALHWLPQGGVCAEVGVLTGAFSAKIDEIVKPARLDLVDSWTFPYDWETMFTPAEQAARDARVAYWKSMLPDYDGGDPRPFWPKLYESLAARYAGDPHVSLHRGLSREVVHAFPAGYFDFIYLDASHTYADVLEDLMRYSDKLKEDGILMGDDFYDNLERPSDYRFVGTVQAVNQFLKRSGFRCVAVTGPGSSNFVLCRRVAGYAQAFLDNLYESNRFFIEINDFQLANYCAKTFTSSTGYTRKYVPSF